ncbi:BTAD domain-containing putative transcriptional regulator [Brevibacillus choshinensis]|uniref:ATP-dependent transcriptional regulator n=1 Tax=Brevibacillus choshinensis TaxID=54911 RepID=A0ABX7FVP6_BRECH|nr:BTAD domain-containing putative transcriptional regulator [Brevibacillus choshinensis]QRG69609.1 ATP-dependent transcriptional regulator [Brevibacillus choshinensis]
MNTPQVSITKITPPKPKPYVLRRPSLAKKLRLLHHVPLCVVHAATGYGKTMTVAAYLHDAKLDTSWYFLTEEDLQLSVFLYGLVESVRRVYPGFGKSIVSSLAMSTDEEREPERLAELFVREWHKLDPDHGHMIVLDDYPHMEPSSQVDTFVRKLAGKLPHQLKLIILSRYKFCWPELELWKARGECLAITAEDLIFSREDTEALFQDEYDVWLTAEEWERIDHVSRGWVLSLRFLGEKMSAGASVAESLRDLARLVHLLEAEVWLRLDEQLQLFLLKAAVLEEFEEEDCRQIIGEEGVGLLSHVYRLNLFIQVDSQGKHSFHPLFHRLLASKLASNRELYLQVNEAAALWYRRKGEEGKAFEHLQLAEKWDVLGEWLCHASERLLTEGKLDILYHWITLLPDAIKEDKHSLWFYQAEVERYRCHYIKAFGSYEHFLTLCRGKHDLAGQCRGLEGMARVHLDSVQGVRAETLLKQAIELLPPAEQGLEMAPRLFRLLAEIYTNRGDAKQAAEWYRRSQELEQMTEVELESRLLFRTGRLQSSIELLEQKSLVERNKHPKLTRSYRETSLLLSFVYALNGEWEKGWQAAETAIELGRAANSPFVEANGYVRKAHAALISQQLPAEEIRVLYEKGLVMMEELQSTRGKSETLLGLTLLHGREKSLDLALQYGKRGMQETEAMRDDWLNSLVRMAIGMAYAAYGKDQEALDMFRDCAERLSLCGDSYGVATCQLWLSFLAYRSKQWELFVPAVTQALSLMQSGEYLFLLQRPTMLTLQDVQQLMPVLIEAERRQVYSDYVSQLLNDLGLQNVTFHPGYTLRIQTLGQFRVWLGEQELSEKAWQRGTAKLLFQLLLTKRQHLLAREEIMNRLWADSDEESAIRDFKVALNALNKALEPNRAARAETFFIQRHGSSYGFNLASGYHIDVEEFERLVTLGMAQPDPAQGAILLEKGLSYYQGDYLPECRYDDWCVEERERLQVLFLRGAERVAKIRLEDNRLEGVIRWCEAILRVDDCWEEAYRLLMTAYYRLNNRAQAIRWYEKCVAKLQEQLGVAPMAATQETYQIIMTQ